MLRCRRLFSVVLFFFSSSFHLLFIFFSSSFRFLFIFFSSLESQQAGLHQLLDLWAHDWVAHALIRRPWGRCALLQHSLHGRTLLLLFLLRIFLSKISEVVAHE